MTDIVQSPLFEPVHWQGTGFKILDESLVPERIEYLEVNDLAQALNAVREMKTRAYGQVLTFLYSAALIAQRYQGQKPGPLRERLGEMTRQFCAVRPTFDFGGLGNFFEQWFASLPADVSAGETIARQARELARQITCGRVARAKRAAFILPNPARVMTHCNVSGELVAVARFCKELGKEFTVIATETRPYLQGARLTAWELAQASVPVTLISDSAVAQVMAKGEVNAVIVGADRSAQNGDIINKVGTYPLALMAKEYGVPFHALVQDPRSVATGNDVPIEERPASEVLFFQGRCLIASTHHQIQVRYPAFDVTPAALITHLIGFDDLYTPESFRRRYQTESSERENDTKASRDYLLVYGVPAENQYSYLMSAVKAHRCESLLVPEMRPQLWGAEVVIPRLLERKAPATLISDNMMGTLFAQGEIKKLCLFYDGLTEAGPSGICGSLLAVQLARLHGVPVELLGGESSRQETNDSDASTFLGMKICPEGASIRAAEVEVVPWALFKDQKPHDQS
jgi:methylthioribose-1-phosphate isomerase